MVAKLTISGRRLSLCIMFKTSLANKSASLFILIRTKTTIHIMKSNCKLSSLYDDVSGHCKNRRRLEKLGDNSMAIPECDISYMKFSKKTSSNEPPTLRQSQNFFML